MLKSIHVLTIYALLMTGCLTRPGVGVFLGEIEKEPPVQVYERAETHFHSKDYETASKLYSQLNTLDPLGSYSEQATLQLIQCHLKLWNMSEAIKAAEKFIRLYPHSPHLEKAWYLKAQATLYENRFRILQYLGLDFSKRDPESIQKAYQQYIEFLKQFPESQYVAEVKEQVFKLREMLANYELHVAHFYFKKKAYQATLNRVNELMEHYPDSSVVKAATDLKQATRQALGLESKEATLVETDQTAQTLENGTHEELESTDSSDQEA